MGSRGLLSLRRNEIFCDDVIITSLYWNGYVKIILELSVKLSRKWYVISVDAWNWMTFVYTQKMSTTVTGCNQLLFKMLQLQNCHLEWTYAHNSQSL